MLFENLPEEQREFVSELKHGSNTIECDVQDALEDAINLNHFYAKVNDAMD